jgi:serine/threonine-protein kinase
MGKTCPACNVTYDDGSVFCPADGTTLRFLVENEDDLVGTVIADRYLLTKKIGEGGMGRVYLAQHVRVPRQAAIKVLRPGLANDYQLIAAFNREANNAAKMGNHPHVAEVYDFGETAEGLIYLAMEYVDGEPLSRFLEREGVVPPRRVAGIVRQVAEALTVAHELPSPVIHRDLKPDNIMLARNRDGSDCVKVVDFGIAKAMTGETQKLTSPGFAVGTPKYMSPEQLSAGTLDARCDIYALGLIAFQMLTGKMPFPSASPDEESTLQWAVSRLVTPPRPLAVTLANVTWPARLQGVFDRVLATAPADRYATAETFARELAEAVDELERGPVGRPATSLPQQAADGRRGVSPRVLIAGGIAAAVVIAVGAVAASGIFGKDDTIDAAASVPPVTAGVDSSMRRDSATGGLAGRGGSAPDANATPVVASPVVTAPVVANRDAPLAGAESRRDARVVRDSAVASTKRADAVDVDVASRAALDSVDEMLARPSNPTPEEATRLLETLRRIRPNLRREDDLRAQVYVAELLLVFGETTEACKLLRVVERDGIGTAAARIADKYLNPSKDVRQLNCPE